MSATAKSMWWIISRWSSASNHFLLLRHQPIQMHPNMRGLSRCIRDRNRAIERFLCFSAATELQQERAFHAEEMKVARQLVRERLDQLERRGGPFDLRHRDRPIQRHDR